MEHVDISVVIPLFNVSAYLPDLLSSLAQQSRLPCKIEVIFVDDGSTDDTARQIEEWIPGNLPNSYRLIRQSNAGVSVARNVGIEAAVGTWITFPDGDDVLTPTYLAEISRFISSPRGHEATMIASRVLRLNDSSGAVTDDHPLRFRFEGGSRVVNCEEEPDFFQLHAASTFFRRSLLTSAVRFPPGVRASEDAIFIARYLLMAGEAKIGFVPRARYLYRRRADGSSATDSYVRHPKEFYLERFRDHYSALLQFAVGRGGAPDWLKSMLLYELHWALGPWQRLGAKRPEVTRELGREILMGFAACAKYLDLDRIMAYDATALPLEARLLLVALKGEPLPEWVPEHIDAYDAETRRTRWRRWVLATDLPDVQRMPSETRDWCRNVTYFGETPLWEIYEWRDSRGKPRSLRSRAVCADRARRVQTGQRLFALSSRANDMRVRRVRLGRGRFPLIAALRWLHEMTRRILLSKTRVVRLLATVLVVRPRAGLIVLSADADVADSLHESEVPVVQLEVFRSRGRVSFRSLYATVAVGRYGRIVSDDPRATMGLLRYAQPRSDRWDLTLIMNSHPGHDEQLALAEGSVRRITSPAAPGHSVGLSIASIDSKTRRQLPPSR